MLDHLGAVVLCVFREPVESDRPVANEVLIVQFFFYQNIYHAERQGAVGAGTDRNPFAPGHLHSRRPSRVDDYDLSSLLARLHDPLHIDRRQVGRRVGAPDDDQLGALDIGESVHEHPPHRYVGRDHPVGNVAECADTHRIWGAERKEDAARGRYRDAFRLIDVAHREFERTDAGVYRCRFRSVLALYCLQAVGYCLIRFVPGDPLEIVRPFRALALHRVEEAILCVDDLGRMLT